MMEIMAKKPAKTNFNWNIMTGSTVALTNTLNKIDWNKIFVNSGTSSPIGILENKSKCFYKLFTPNP